MLRAMSGFAAMIGFVLLWVLLQQWLLPRLGVPT
jgi:hypothetical protein